MLKKIICLIGIFSVILPCFSQGVPSELFSSKPDIEKLNGNLDTLDDTWNRLILENQMLKKDINEIKVLQEMQYDDLVSQIIYSANITKRNMELEKEIKVYRTVTSVSVAVTVVTVVISLIILKND